MHWRFKTSLMNVFTFIIQYYLAKNLIRFFQLSNLTLKFLNNGGIFLASIDKKIDSVFIIKLVSNHLKITFVLINFGGVGETRTLASVTRPMSLAGTPLHQLEYHSECFSPYRC